MFSRLISEFSGQLIMLVLIYILVLVMIFLDLWAGVRKAKQRGEYRSSYGLRKTGIKVAQYFNVLMLMTVVDALQMLFVWYLNPQINLKIPVVPIFTFCMALFYGIIEGKSMYEKAEDKDKGKYQDAAKLAKEVLSNKEAQSIIANVFGYLKDEKKDDKDQNDTKYYNQYPTNHETE